MITISNTNKELLFNLKVEGTTLSETKAYLVLEFDGSKTRVQMPVHIESTGKCKVDLDLGLIKEDKGKVMLEVVAKDLLFTPWAESFVFEAPKTVKTNITEQKNVVKDKKTVLAESLSKMNEKQRNATVLIIAKKLIERQK